MKSHVPKGCPPERSPARMIGQAGIRAGLWQNNLKPSNLFIFETQNFRMIALDNISVRFGGFDLFKSVSLMINDKEKVALVGKNGAGKSTLLKLITGIESPEDGKVVVPRDQTIGYLPQKMIIKDNLTVFEEALTAFEEVLTVEKKIEVLNKELSGRNDFESKEYIKLLHDISDANERFRLLGGGTIRVEVERTLLGLGFLHNELNKPTSVFSGGWRMRIELARILLRKPDILLLDEPTNHLDIESILWLENLLKNYEGSVLLISHDRLFLDRITTRTIEIYLGKLYDYNVPYSKFVKLREERREQLLAAYRNQQKMIEKTEEFIERFRYKATKAVQVQSRIKQLEKLERIEVEETEHDIHFEFPPAPRAGDLVVELSDLNKSYGEKSIIKDVNLIIERGEKVSFVGRNGEGKTTLARIIVRDLDHEGLCKIGYNVSIGYYAQNQDELLDENKTVLQTIDDIATGDIRTRIRGLLGAFLFGNDDIDKKVKVLSGGERSRLSLIKLLLKPVSLLVLDEPTNHLDLKSKDILKNALINYNGTLIIVSHDRYFMDGLTDKVYEFANKKVKEYMGGIFDFLEKRQIGTLQDLEINFKISQTEKKGDSERKKQYLDRKNQERELRKLRNKIKKLENEIENLEILIREKDEVLANSENIPPSGEENNFYANYNKLKHKLSQLINEWEIVSEELEQKEK